MQLLKIFQGVNQLLSSKHHESTSTCIAWHGFSTIWHDSIPLPLLFEQGSSRSGGLRGKRANKKEVMQILRKQVSQLSAWNKLDRSDSWLLLCALHCFAFRLLLFKSKALAMQRSNCRNPAFKQSALARCGFPTCWSIPVFHLCGVRYRSMWPAFSLPLGKPLLN